MQVTKSVKAIKVIDVKGKLDVKFLILSEPIEEISYDEKKLMCKIQFGETFHIWRINNMSKDTLIDGLGTETSKWVGKTIDVHIENINGKEAIIATKEQF